MLESKVEKERSGSGCRAEEERKKDVRLLRVQEGCTGIRMSKYHQRRNGEQVSSKKKW